MNRVCWLGLYCSVLLGWNVRSMYITFCQNLDSNLARYKGNLPIIFYLDFKKDEAT